VKAYVVVREGFTDQITAQAIIQFCEGKIAAFKVPHQVELTAELPKTGVGKVLKRELKRVARP
jgi:long-chain acyl-CoA synthetase